MTQLSASARAALAAMLLPTVSGCASIAASYGTEAVYNGAFRERIADASRLSAQDRDRLLQVKVLDTAPGREAEPKGEVVGFACKLTAAVFVFKWVWKPELNEANGLNPEDAARTQLRIKAAQAGANAIVAPTCTHQEGIDWRNNCFESWRCTAQAYVLP